MILGIYSLKRILYEGEAKSVNLKAVRGELTILDHHRPLIAALNKGPVKITGADEKQVTMTIRSGFLEVKPGGVVNLLVDE